MRYTSKTRRMKSYVQLGTGKDQRKYDPNDHAGRINLGKHGEDVSDKTQFCSARPGSKKALRQANRAYKKRARQALKRQLDEEGREHPEA